MSDNLSISIFYDHIRLSDLDDDTPDARFIINDNVVNKVSTGKFYTIEYVISHDCFLLMHKQKVISKYNFDLFIDKLNKKLANSQLQFHIRD